MQLYIPFASISFSFVPSAISLRGDDGYLFLLAHRHRCAAPAKVLPPLRQFTVARYLQAAGHSDAAKHVTLRRRSSSSLLLAAKTCQRSYQVGLVLRFIFFSNWCHTSYLSLRARINIVFHFPPLVVWCLRCLFEVFLTRSIWLCQSKVTLNPHANVVTSSLFSSSPVPTSTLHSSRFFFHFPPQHTSGG
jgi:hypothetical protein